MVDKFVKQDEVTIEECNYYAGKIVSRTRGYVTNVAESMFYNKKEKNMPPSNGLYNMKTLGMDFRTSWKVVVAYEKFVNKDGTNDILWVAL